MRARRLIADDSGFTLIELLVVTALLGLVLTAVLSLLDTTSRLAPEDTERSLAVRDAQVGLQLMTVELRQAYSLTVTNPYSLTAKVYRRGVDTQVTYDCSGAAANPAWGKCIRTAGGANSDLVQAIVNASGSGRPPVFTYTQRADGRTTYVRVHLEVPVRDRATGRYSYSVPLEDGTYLRNIDN